MGDGRPADLAVRPARLDLRATAGDRPGQRRPTSIQKRNRARWIGRNGAAMPAEKYWPPTRRPLLVGLTPACLGVLGPRAAAQAAPGPEMTALSAYMAGAADRALPAEVVEKAKHHILDT